MFRLIHRIGLIRGLSTQSVNHLVDSLASTISGVERETLENMLKSIPQLTRYGPDLWQRTYGLIAQEGFETANFLSIVTGYPEVLMHNPDRLAASLSCWRSCQFGDKQMQILLAAHPHLLELTDHNRLAQRVAFLHSHFETRKNIWRLFLNSPNLVADSQAKIQAKIDYILQRMRIEVLEVVKSCAFSSDLETIQCRHVFLERLGLFKPRKLKATPSELSNNPKLHQITDTSDKRFAVKVAYVTLEEFEVFQELFRREQNESQHGEDFDGIDASENEHDNGGEFDEIGEQKMRKHNYRKESKSRSI
ncbi:uncharacterized protein LOC129777759 [Toxorhynchites rutilus septentrionalis]|uniref:uncharacterized protein LOC129777759 n=1 Tax=Toxorhynchites rutilus septentrionalis TaxID=329112 RepID=UPI00247AB5CE|nr:uncharacterized protein LOC129777759 [Toxorhynchites rutilus septentrionalis]